MRTITLNPETATRGRDSDPLRGWGAGCERRPPSCWEWAPGRFGGCGPAFARRAWRRWCTATAAARRPIAPIRPCVERIVALAGPDGKYHDLNVCHLQELLEREEQIVIGRSTLDRLLQAGWTCASRPRPPRRCIGGAGCAARPKGMLLQIDGSPFAWLEERGPKADLIGAIDDATGKVLFLLFRPTEDQVGYLLLLRSIAQCYGLPMSIYHDRHTILRSPKQPTLEEQLAGQTPMSQVQRVMAELGIESIAGLLAPGQRAHRAAVGHPAGPPDQGVAPGRHHHPGSSQCLSARLHRALQRPLRQGPCRPPQRLGAAARRPRYSPTTSPSARPARCAPITASASPASACNCCPAPRTPAWSTRRSPCMSCPKETSIVYYGKRRIAYQPVAAPQATPAAAHGPATPAAQPRPTQAPRPSNGRGSLASTNAACAQSPPVLDCRHLRGG